MLHSGKSCNSEDLCRCSCIQAGVAGVTFRRALLPKQELQFKREVQVSHSFVNCWCCISDDSLRRRIQIRVTFWVRLTGVAIQMRVIGVASQMRGFQALRSVAGVPRTGQSAVFQVKELCPVRCGDISVNAMILLLVQRGAGVVCFCVVKILADQNPMLCTMSKQCCDMHPAMQQARLRVIFWLEPQTA